MAVGKGSQSQVRDIVMPRAEGDAGQPDQSVRCSSSGARLVSSQFGPSEEWLSRNQN